MSVRLYVGNLPEDADRQALEDLFTAAGEVVSTKIMRDSKTGKCLGYGFLTVNTQEQADQYIEKFNGQSFGDNTLKIELAKPRNKGKDSDSSGGEREATPKPRPRDAAATAPEGSSSTSGGNKKRNRDRSGQGSGTVTSSTAATSGQPDPRWASQLQRIKEQLQAANPS
jgi:RNA recognition motif-containing protein